MQVEDIERVLAAEGSDLVIQKANSDNLDWTWRVRHNNGRTGLSVTWTGADLRDTIAVVVAAASGTDRAAALDLDLT